MPPQITLRQLHDDDLDIIFQQECDPEAIHMAAFVGEDPTNRNAFDAHFAKIRAKDNIELRTIEYQGQVAGHIASFFMGDQQEVTYWIGREYWEQGIATAALTEFLYEITDRPLYARAAADNAASIRVLEKCGFSKIADERSYAQGRRALIDEVVLRLDAS